MKMINWENAGKVMFILLGTVGVVEFMVLTGFSFVSRNTIYALTASLFFVLVCICLAGAMLRDKMKLDVSTKGVSVEYEEEDNDGQKQV